MRKLTWAQVRYIRDEYDSGEATVRQLAYELRMSEIAILRIVRRESWREA